MPTPVHSHQHLCFSLTMAPVCPHNTDMKRSVENAGNSSVRCNSIIHVHKSEIYMSIN